VQTWITQGLLSVGHAKVLLGLKAHEEQLATAETILRRSGTVRDAERLVARQLGTRTRRRRAAVSATIPSAALDDLQSRLQQHLGTRVTLHHGEKRGRIEIEYYGNEDFQRILTAIGLPSTES
jgi:ParB family chromosome partitioning protein